MIDHYDWAGGREAMLRFGPGTGPVVIAALPLFEEANRTRAFLVAILRHLADLGIAGALPDFPGTGESLFPAGKTDILTIQHAYDALVEHFGSKGRLCVALGIRSGALLDALGLLAARWHLAPQTGPELLRELTRIKQAATGARDPLPEEWFFAQGLPEDALDPRVEIAGNIISVDLLAELTVKTPMDGFDASPRRIVRLAGDPQPADLKIEGAPLWRRSEPGTDPVLAAALGDDIARWVRQCVG